jgi:hypothetical protein
MQRFVHRGVTSEGLRRRDIVPRAEVTTRGKMLRKSPHRTNRRLDPLRQAIDFAATRKAFP